MAKAEHDDDREAQPTEVEHLAPRCPLCDDCEARRDDVGAGVQSWEHIPQLETADEVVKFPGRTDTSELHSGETDGILAHYALSEDVACSLKGRHPHRQGLVIRTLCDLVLCMGFHCGAKSIIGFDQLKAEYKRRTTFQQEVLYVGGWASKFERRIVELRPRVKALRDTADLLKTRLPDLVSALDVRRRTKGGLEVHLPGGAGSEHLRGTPILDADKYDPRKLEEMLTAFQRQLADNPPITGPACTALMRRAREYNRKADAFDAWLHEAGEFVGERNLGLALLVLNREGQIAASKEGVTVKYFGAPETFLPYVRPRAGDQAAEPTSGAPTP